MLEKSEKKKIRCLIRNELVAKTPEEIIRQKVLYQLINVKKFPKSGIVLEKALKTMPHLFRCADKIPNRRADIICFAKGIHKEHDLYPLLMVECKAVKLTPQVKSQVFGYNYFVKAHFVAIANEKELQFGFYDENKKDYCFISSIPTYDELLSMLQ